MHLDKLSVTLLSLDLHVDHKCSSSDPSLDEKPVCSSDPSSERIFELQIAYKTVLEKNIHGYGTMLDGGKIGSGVSYVQRFQTRLARRAGALIYKYLGFETKLPTAITLNDPPIHSPFLGLTEF